jgi:hypothetical protein
MKKAQHVLYYDPSPIWGNPAKIKESTELCKKLGMTYFPTFEAYEYTANHVEYDNEAFIVGRQLKPFGLEWLAYRKQCYNDPLICLNRIAYREFYKIESNFKQIVRNEMFGKKVSPKLYR